MNLKFIELELDWPSDLRVFELRKYILSMLMNYGEPLRWAITSSTNYSRHSIQKISIEAVLIVNNEKIKDINTSLT